MIARQPDCCRWRWRTIFGQVASADDGDGADAVADTGTYTIKKMHLPFARARQRNLTISQRSVSARRMSVVRKARCASAKNARMRRLRVRGASERLHGWTQKV